MKFSECKNIPSFSFGPDGLKRSLAWFRCPEGTFALFLEETTASGLTRPPVLGRPSLYLKILIGESVILVAREGLEFVVVE